MKRIETKVILDKSIAQVWDRLTDFNEYPKWNPFIKNIRWKNDNKEELLVEINSNNKSTMKFEPKVLVFNQNKEIRWRGKLLLKGIFDGEHYFILKEISKNKTELTHGEKFSGLLSPLLFTLIKANTLKGFEEMNRAI